jgi:hypothetical protein
MLLDEFLPQWDVRQHHATLVRATPEEVYRAVRRLDLGRSGLNRWLFRARGLPLGRQITLSDMMSRGFVLLGEDAPRELVLGLIARPWALVGGVRRVDAEAFRRFGRPGYARIGWAFVVKPRSAGWARLETEIRVRCTDEASRRRFRRYWRLIRPFSGMVRKQALLIIKRDAERVGLAKIP